MPRRVRQRPQSWKWYFGHRLAEARTRSGLAAVLVRLHAAGDILCAVPHEVIRNWRRRGRVGIPERQSVMIGSDLRYTWRALVHQKFGSADTMNPD